MSRPDVTLDRLREFLSYEPDTGLFRWIKRRKKVRVGSIAGCVGNHGYLLIKIDQKLYSAHRLAWLYVHERWPTDQIDHINGVRDDNRIANIREATTAENHQNRAVRADSISGLIGVGWYEPCKKWRARINVGGVEKYLGLFCTVEDATAARAKAKAELHIFQPVDRGCPL